MTEWEQVENSRLANYLSFGLADAAIGRDNNYASALFYARIRNIKSREFVVVSIYASGSPHRCLSANLSKKVKLLVQCTIYVTARSTNSRLLLSRDCYNARQDEPVVLLSVPLLCVSIIRTCYSINFLTLKSLS